MVRRVWYTSSLVSLCHAVFDTHFTNYNGSGGENENQDAQYVSKKWRRKLPNPEVRPEIASIFERGPGLSDPIFLKGDVPDLLKLGVRPEHVDFWFHIAIHGMSVMVEDLPMYEQSIVAAFVDLGIMDLQDNGEAFAMEGIPSLRRVLKQCPVPIVSTRTQFQQLRISSFDGAFYMEHNGVIQFHSREWEFTHSALALPAVAARDLDSALILGGGDGLAAQILLRFPEAKNIINMELDPAMIELTRSNPLLKELSGGSFVNSRVNVTPADAVAFVRDTELKFDVIIDDCDYRNTDQPGKVLLDDMLAYYTNIRRHLKPGGVGSTMQEIDAANCINCLKIAQALYANTAKPVSWAEWWNILDYVEGRQDGRPRMTTLRAFRELKRKFRLSFPDLHRGAINCWKRLFEELVNATTFVEVPTVHLGTELIIMFPSEGAGRETVFSRQRPLPGDFFFDEERVDRIFAAH